MHSTDEGQTGLIAPYGGHLVNLVVGEEERLGLLERARNLRALRLSPRSVCDLELLATGGFSPLDRFMRQSDYERVIEDMRLASGMIFPIPVTLPIPADTPLTVGDEVVLHAPNNELLAVMMIEELYRYDWEAEARRVCGTADPRHPLVAEMASWGSCYASGPLRVLSLPRHYDFPSLRLSPRATRAALRRLGFGRVVAFQTRNPMHRAHEWITRKAAEKVDAALLIHPVVGLTKPGDVDHYTRVRCYRVLVERYFDSTRTLLSLLPLAMRMAGPPEAVWHAIIRRNYGATHFIVGRDHASPGRDSRGHPFYGPFDAQHLLASFEDEVGVKMVPFGEVVYIVDEDRYEEAEQAPRERRLLTLSGTEAREALSNGQGLPVWYTRPEVAEMLLRAHPPRASRGFCVWFTGLPCAGKSTIAEILTILLMERGRQVTLLDGDVVRTHLSKGLGFTKKDRDTNILRIGFVAAEIVRHHGTVVAAAISPYEATREQVRSMVGEEEFILVHIDTPVEVCEKRDTKGLYKRARAGLQQGVTGVDDAYEPPVNPDLRLETVATPPEENARAIAEHLIARGFLEAPPGLAIGERAKV